MNFYIRLIVLFVVIIQSTSLPEEETSLKVRQTTKIAVAPKISEQIAVVFLFIFFIVPAILLKSIETLAPVFKFFMVTVPGWFGLL